MGKKSPSQLSGNKVDYGMALLQGKEEHMTPTETKPDYKLLEETIKKNIRRLYRKDFAEANSQEIFQALSLAIKDVVIDDWLKTQQAIHEQKPKIVYYMSMEFLMGRALGNILLNLCRYDNVKKALDEMGIDINAIEDEEPDPALGNGGLGRLAACFMDSLASLGYAGHGNGIRYRFGLFRQSIVNGVQVEQPDNWLANGYPWEVRRPEHAVKVRFGGRVEHRYDGNHLQIEYQACIGYNIRDFSPVYSKVIGGPSYEQTAFLRYPLSGLDPGSQQEIQAKPDSCRCKGKR